MENMEIMLNQIDIDKCTFDYKKIDAAFDFFLIKNDRGKNPDRKVLESASFHKNIVAIQYTGGSSLILMLKKDSNNFQLIEDFIEEYSTCNDMALSKEHLAVPFLRFPHSMIQVMLNALTKRGTEENISNILGKFFYFSSKNKTQVFCIEVRVKDGYLLELNNVTFTASQKPNYISYVLSDNNTMKLKTDSDTIGPFYDKFQYEHKRHLTPFCDTNPSVFNSTKMGILARVFKTFNKTYEGMAHIVMKREIDWTKIEVNNSTTLIREHMRFIKKILENKTIRIVNGIKDELYSDIAEAYCKELCEQMKDLFTSEKYFTKDDRKINFDIKIRKNLGKDDLNILLIHNKAFYSENHTEKDPYNASDARVIQHITLEDFSMSTKPTSENYLKPNKKAALVLINELLIKEGLLQTNEAKHISLCNWSDYAFTNDMIFCTYGEEKKWIDEVKKYKVLGKYYIFMKVHPDGTFEITSIKEGEENNIVDENTYKKVQKIFSMNQFYKYYEQFKALVINDKGDINIIQDTEYEMYPNFELLSKTLETATISKRASDIDKEFLGTIDIHYKETEECGYYSVGEIGHGMSGSMPRATLVRKSVPYDGSSIFWNKLLDTMNVVFVRNGRLTVLPFPFKYINEYAKMINVYEWFK